MIEDLKEESKMLSSEKIQNEVLNINSENLYYNNHIERNIQANISPSDKSFEKQEE